MLRTFSSFCVLHDFVELQVAAFGRNVCWSQLSWKEVAFLRGNDCRKTEVLFDKASFESEFKRSWRLFLVFTPFPPGMRKKANI